MWISNDYCYYDSVVHFLYLQMAISHFFLVFFLVFLVYILSIRTQILHFTNNLRFNVILSFLMSFTLRTCTSIGEITQLFTNNLKNRLELKHKTGKKNFSKKKNFFSIDMCFSSHFVIIKWTNSISLRIWNF